MAQVIADFSCQPGSVRKSLGNASQGGASAEIILTSTEEGRPATAIVDEQLLGRDSSSVQRMERTQDTSSMCSLHSSSFALSSCCLDFPNMTHCALNWELT